MHKQILKHTHSAVIKAMTLKSRIKYEYHTTITYQIALIQWQSSEKETKLEKRQNYYDLQMKNLQSTGKFFRIIPRV